MNISFRKIARLLLAGALFAHRLAPADALDQTGVRLLRQQATNVDGSGIRVAQPEAAAPTFEVRPTSLGQPASLFSYFSAAGRADVYPNSVGVESGHANGVGNTFYGNPAGVATNVAHVDNYDADFFITNYVFNLAPAPAAAIVNESYTFGPQTIADQQAVDSAYDDYQDYFGTIFVSAACNASISLVVCSPGTDYNCISVGAYYGGNYYNSIGPTIDNGRCKPDLTALSTATSFSTPQVSGAVAVLLQAALRGDGGGDTNSAADVRTLKAALLNGAVKPAGWTNSNASPLDARHGAGVLNLFNAYEQLIGGKQNFSVSSFSALGGAHPPVAVTNHLAVLSGWDFCTNSTSATNDAVNHYFFNVANGSVTATLVWNRQFSETNINNLDLFLFNAANSNLVACSTSRVDNVEHIFVPQLPAGRYDLQVLKNGGTNVVSDTERYALAWAFVSPTLRLAKSGMNLTLTWPVYPDGFTVEATTNLSSTNWDASGLAAASVTNSMNSLPLNATNAAQFFRLRPLDF